MYNEFNGRLEKITFSHLTKPRLNTYNQYGFRWLGIKNHSVRTIGSSIVCYCVIFYKRMTIHKTKKHHNIRKYFANSAIKLFSPYMQILSHDYCEIRLDSLLLIYIV